MAIATATAQMVQLNLRVDAQEKAQAAEVLRLMGLTVSDFVRAALAKVARGAADCEQLLEALEEPEEVPLSPALARSWEICDDFAKMLGYESADDMPKDDRPWEEILEEARLAHYREKGLLS